MKKGTITIIGFIFGLAFLFLPGLLTQNGGILFSNYFLIYLPKNFLLSLPFLALIYGFISFIILITLQFLFIKKDRMLIKAFYFGVGVALSFVSLSVVYAFLFSNFKGL